MLQVSNSTQLVFRYTILAGDNDSNGISIRASALALNNGTISDPALNNAILTHSAVVGQLQRQGGHHGTFGGQLHYV